MISRTDFNREHFEAAGGQFSVENFKAPSDPDTPIFEGNLTLKDTTVTLAGKSEQEILDQAYTILLSSEPARLEEGYNSGD